MMFDWRIYVLLDPNNGKVRYVGRTSRPDRRENQHHHLYPCEERLSGNTPYVQWKKSLLEQGQRPIFKVISVGGREWWWVRYFAKKGQPLTNRVIPQCTPQKIVRLRNASK